MLMKTFMKELSCCTMAHTCHLYPCLCLCHSHLFPCLFLLCLCFPNTKLTRPFVLYEHITTILILLYYILYAYFHLQLAEIKFCRGRVYLWYLNHHPTHKPLGCMSERVIVVTLSPSFCHSLSILEDDSL